MEHSNLSPLDISGPAHVVSERWRKWRRSFHFYVTSKGLRDPPQLRALLLHLAGEAVQDVHESLNLTFSAGEDVYVRTLAELDKQFEVKANQPYERHVFRQMVQQPNETVAQFVTKLKTQAQFCNFQDRDDQIRDQLLHAMADMELREKLLETDQLTLHRNGKIKTTGNSCSTSKDNVLKHHSRSAWPTLTAPTQAFRANLGVTCFNFQPSGAISRSLISCSSSSAPDAEWAEARTSHVLRVWHGRTLCQKSKLSCVWKTLQFLWLQKSFGFCLQKESCCSARTTSGGW